MVKQKKDCRDQLIFLQNNRTKGLHDNGVSISIYTYTCLQYTLLNLIKGDKQYDAVIINTNNYKENMKQHIHLPFTCKLIIHICTHIYVNTGKERVFMIKSFLFNIQKKSFHDIVISLVQ